jgi:hypothetical protein
LGNVEKLFINRNKIMNLLSLKSSLQIDDIINYPQLVAVEGVVQRGMNFRLKGRHSIFLMSLRKGAPYADEFDEATNTLIYEGHDVYKDEGSNPKESDQPFFTKNGTLTDNGKFFTTAHAFKLGLISAAHKVKVYEKLRDGIWCYKGYFNLIDAKIVDTGIRKVFKYFLQPVEIKKFKEEYYDIHTRLIPSEVKLEVWKRDKGQCVICGSTENLHYDHDLPYSKGGTSLSAKNVRILCMKHNLKKSNKILSIIPVF